MEASRSWYRDEPVTGQPGISTLRAKHRSQPVTAGLRRRALRCVAPAIGLLVGLCLAPVPALADTSVVTTTPGPMLATPEVVAATSTGYLGGIGSDGSEGVWFAEGSNANNGALLVHYQPAPAGLTAFSLASASPFSEVIDGIAPGPNETEWFARFYDNEISHLTAGGKLITKKLPAQTEPQDIVVDQQGVAWFTSRGHGCELGRLPIRGKATFYDIGGDCYDLTIGPDGNIWIADYTANKVIEMSDTTGAPIAEYALRLPVAIATLGDDVYITETEPGVVAQIGPSGAVTEYVLPAGRKLEGVTAGPDDAVWLDETAGPDGEPAIGRLTPTGVLSELSESHGGVGGITATTDAIYFTAGTNVIRIPLSNLSPPDDATYVALGDSFSAGEGNPPYESGSDERDFDECHRSEWAYAPVLDQELSLGTFLSRACSGATTADMFEANPDNHEPPQLNWLSDATGLVTLTIGGIDAGFVQAMYECVAGLRPTLPLPFKGYGCSTDPTLINDTLTALDALEGTGTAWAQGRRIHPILSVIEAIHAKAPNANIIIGGYPLIFGSHARYYTPNPLAPGGKMCIVEPNGIDGVPYLSVGYLDAQWLNEQGSRLDGIIRLAVKVAQKKKHIPVTYANAALPFRTHAMCDSNTTWFHPVELAENLVPEKGSLHPTLNGQTLGLATAFREQIG